MKFFIHTFIEISSKIPIDFIFVMDIDFMTKSPPEKEYYDQD